MIFNYLIIFLVAFCLALSISPIVYGASKKLKANQTILHYVTEHESKNGTPTMGGVVMLIAMLLTITIMGIWSPEVIALVLAIVAAGLLGLIDDVSKVVFQRSLGLTPTVKLIFQFLIATVFILYASLYVPEPKVFPSK